MNSLLLFVAAQMLQGYFSRFGYLGIYVWFITIDQIAPLPEEITLIVIGYFASLGLMNPVLAGVFSILGFITIDLIYFGLTHSGSKLILRFTGKLENQRMARYKNLLKEHPFKALLVLCFIPRMRLLAPTFAALLKIPFKKFLLYDVITLCIFTSLYILLGVLFHASLRPLIEKTQVLGHVIFIGAMVVMTLVTFLIIRDKKKK